MDTLSELQRTKSIAEATLAAMLRHGVPPTPNNYMVWYAHLSGNTPELSRAIDILVSNKQEFTPRRNDELFQRFFGSEGALAALQQSGDQLQELVGRVQRQVEAAGGAASDYGRTLDTVQSEIGKAEDVERLRGIVSGLVEETQRVADRNAVLQQQLSKSSGEISQLRQNLEAVRHEAMTDALTGIANRKSFDERLRGAAREAMETGEPMSLLFIDIDYFKRFNDTYGHQLGDQVLSLVAKTLTDSVKGRDTAARYGGEEFAIILPQTRLSDAQRLADQIRNTMMRRRIVGKSTGEDYGTITVSIGVGAYRPGEPLTDLLGRADAALYQAKKSGRNRVASEPEIVEVKIPA